MFTFFQSLILEPGFCDSWGVLGDYGFSTNRRQAEDMGLEGGSCPGKYPQGPARLHKDLQ